uniref:ARAD1C26290p n=1 Tax=Blastobotrys adeninivorans TaxID=409370 RepID=A0A060T824_BLAAD
MLRMRPQGLQGLARGLSAGVLRGSKASPRVGRPFHSFFPRLNVPKSAGGVGGPASHGSKRMTVKELTKKYGWSAVGVYLALSAIDLPLCFLFVHSMGQEKVQELERKVKGWFGYSTKDEDLKTGTDESGDEADSKWSLYLTEFGIAYAIHKSVFLFVRIPLTAAITPWTVRTLRRWGFNIGNGTNKAAGAAASTKGKPDFGKPPTQRQKWTSWFF